jgi:hypothetical protein
MVVKTDSICHTKLSSHVVPIDSDDMLTGEAVGGWIDLDWCFESKIPYWHTPCFLVTTIDDAPYDAVLGKKDVEQYGLLRSRSRR